MKNSDLMNAGDLLRSIRISQGFSLRTVAKEVGIAPSNLSRIERGERVVSEESSKRLANYYGVSQSLVTVAGGRIPQDVIEILQRNPELVDQIRRRYVSDQLDN